MPSIHLEGLSPFGRLAVKLDGDFAELSRVSGLIEKLDLDSDGDLDHAAKLLKQFSQQGERIAQSMQEFSLALQEANARADAAAKSVQERAQKAQERRRRRDGLEERLLGLEKDVKAANAGLTSVRIDGKGLLTDEEKSKIHAEFQRLQERLGDFIAAAQAIKEEAVRLGFKRVGRDAHSILDTLQALRRKLQDILSEK